MASHDIGDRLTLTATFRDSAGTAADPTAVTLTLRKPDGTTATPTPATSGAGVYRADVTLDMAGTWSYRWAGTGAVTAAEEGTLYVRRSAVLA